ncbi:hypothetical protein BH10PSE17_BH10PSE17_05660 [soil metagenome]
MSNDPVRLMTRMSIGVMRFCIALSLAAAQAICPTQAQTSGTEILVNGSFASGLSDWIAEPATLAAERARRSGDSVWLRDSMVQRIAPGRLVEGQAYVVRVWRDPGSGPGTVAVVFRVPDWNQSIRTYSRSLESSDEAVTELSFEAPAYNRMAELKLSSDGTAGLRIKQVSVTARAPIDRTSAIADDSGSYVPDGYRLVFNDEFDGVALDRSKWFTRFIYEGETLDHLTDEQQRYRDNDNHVVSSGTLKLVARPTGGGLYESGMIRSDWTLRYGYLEARVKMPRAKGVFPAFWLNSDVAADGTHRWPPEIDIFEFVNNGVEDTPDMLHTGVVPEPGATNPFLFTTPGFDKRWTYWKAPFRFDEGWHTIGAEWTENTVSTYVDGRKIVERGYPWRYNDGRLAAKAYVMLNLAIGGKWAGRHGIDDSQFPASLEVDWVRAYQRPESEATKAR